MVNSPVFKIFFYGFIFCLPIISLSANPNESRYHREVAQNGGYFIYDEGPVIYENNGDPGLPDTSEEVFNQNEGRYK